MEMRRCERGHYYDASMHASCPYCNREENAGKTVAMGVTVAGGTTVAKDAMTTAGNTTAGQVPLTRPMTAAGNIAAGQVPLMRPVTSAAEEGKTVAIFQTEQGVDPAVGWLVSLTGKEKGKDYRLHSDNNFVGRSEKMDVCIKNDDTISRENQAVVTYDAESRSYFFSPGEGRSVIRLNGKAIFQTAELAAYDKLTIGKTELLFIPLCGEEFAWGEE